MNKIDCEFNELVNKIKTMSVDEIFFNIKKTHTVICMCFLCF